MKKLMIAATAIAFAVVTQAAAVYWGGAVSTPDGTEPLPAGTVAALLWSETLFSGAATTLEKFEVGIFADNGGTIVKTYTMNSDDGDAWAFKDIYENSAGSVDGYYAILVLNEEGTMASYFEVDPITGTDILSSPTDRIINGDWFEEVTLTQGGYTVQVGDAIPEPTSGLLLLLGVAGLALKRRRA